MPRSDALTPAPLYSRGMLPVSDTILNIERTAAEDANVRQNARALAAICLRIAEQSAPRDFLDTLDGRAFLNAVHAMTGCDALYDGVTYPDEDPDAEFYNAADYGHDTIVADGLAA